MVLVLLERPQVQVLALVTFELLKLTLIYVYQYWLLEMILGNYIIYNNWFLLDQFHVVVYYEEAVWLLIYWLRLYYRLNLTWLDCDNVALKISLIHI